MNGNIKMIGFVDMEPNIHTLIKFNLSGFIKYWIIKIFLSDLFIATIDEYEKTMLLKLNYRKNVYSLRTVGDENPFIVTRLKIK